MAAVLTFQSPESFELLILTTLVTDLDSSFSMFFALNSDSFFGGFLRIKVANLCLESNSHSLPQELHLPKILFFLVTMTISG